MRALIIKGKENMSLEEMEGPKTKGDQILISPKYIGICGSDIHYYFNGANGTAVIREPFIPGHEFSGTLVHDELINGEKYPSGSHVTVHPATWGKPVKGAENKREIWPGGSYYGSAASLPHCQGGMRNLMSVNKDQIRFLPHNLLLRDGALAEPLSVALHGLTLAGDVSGKNIFVSGAGPIGLLTTVSCLLKDAKKVTVSDMLGGPLRRAKDFSENKVETINLGAGEKIPSTEFDIVFECSGSAAGITSAFDAVDLGGEIIQIGMIADRLSPVNLAPACTKEVTYKGSLRFDKEFDEAINLLTDHSVISKVITHEFPASEAVEAFNVARDAEKSGKVMISF